MIFSKFKWNFFLLFFFFTVRFFYFIIVWITYFTVSLRTFDDCNDPFNNLWSGFLFDQVCIIVSSVYVRSLGSIYLKYNFDIMFRTIFIKFLFIAYNIRWQKFFRREYRILLLRICVQRDGKSATSPMEMGRFFGRKRRGGKCKAQENIHVSFDFVQKYNIGSNAFAFVYYDLILRVFSCREFAPSFHYRS